MLGYTFGSEEVDQVWFSGQTTTVVNAHGEIVAEYSYLGKLGAIFYVLRHPFGAHRKRGA